MFFMKRRPKGAESNRKNKGGTSPVLINPWKGSTKQSRCEGSFHCKGPMGVTTSALRVRKGGTLRR